MIDTGVVVIGRNEGERLKTCLQSVVANTDKIVYVDSGSTDDSVSFARNLGVDVVNLNLTTPFTAARARNEGFSQLTNTYPELKYVQFVDGDCEVYENWLIEAHTYLVDNPGVAVVCGRRRERYPDQSIYNLLCDLEWDTPIGETKSCGGDALMRIDAFLQVGGYNANLIAGEEPELCLRLRREGWTIWRLDRDMTLHDAAIMKFTQWWKRNVRAGHAFAEGAFLHGNSFERHSITESRRSLIWGLFFPVAVIFISVSFASWFFLFLMVYPLQVIRNALNGNRTIRQNWIYSIFLVLCKFPEAMGQIKFWKNRILNRQIRIIEYK